MKAYIFGAGISGASAARKLAEAGYSVTVYEKNGFVGGNAYDYLEDGILVHKFGPHIFHTSSKAVFEFLSKYSEFMPYEHKVIAKIDDKFVPIPFNLTSLYELFDKKTATYIDEVLRREIGIDKKIPIIELKNHSDKIIAEFGEFVYQKVFHNYTLKQWGFTPSELPKGVMERVPVYISYMDKYFTDTYQQMPKHGFTSLVSEVLNHKNIEVVLNSKQKLELNGSDIFIDGNLVDSSSKVIYCGSLDELFSYKYSPLAYRSLDFVFERLEMPSYQMASVVNYPNEEKFTRITEFTKFTSKEQPHTIIVREYPREHIPEQTIAYYPIEKEQNLQIYNNYLNDAKKCQNFYPLGRLAEYKYINMDKAVENALSLADTIISLKK